MLATLILGLGLANGQAQSETYYYSGPVNGANDGSGFTEVDLSPNGGSGGFVADFGTLTETITYNPTAERRAMLLLRHPPGLSISRGCSPATCLAQPP